MLFVDEARRDEVRVVALPRVVEFRPQGRTELLCEPDGVVTARDGRTPRGHVGEPVEQLEVGSDSCRLKRA